MLLCYEVTRDLPLADVALLLGFSETAAFHRAFRRWTAQTPLEYRRGRRR
jgi:AraC-like DNA-binding protein